MRKAQLVLVTLLVVACGGDDGNSSCEPEPFEHGDDGHAAPLSAPAGQARAGRLQASDLPPSARGLADWKAGDFVLANDRVAIAIEDVGPSENYDPWGGKPIGYAQIEDGKLVDATDFGEMFLLTGRFSILTEQVSVINDGSDGQPAVVRASGILSPIPFLEPFLGELFLMKADGIVGALDYTLAPDSNEVEVSFHYRSSRDKVVKVEPNIHAFMFTKRLDVFVESRGFGSEGKPGDFVIFADDDATSVAYRDYSDSLKGGIGQSGFVSNFVDPFDIAACGETERKHAVITIGGPGLQGLQKVMAGIDGTSMQTIAGTVRDANGVAQAGVRVHAETTTGAYLTRVFTDAEGGFSLDVEAGLDVQVYAFRQGEDIVGPVAVSGGQADLAFAEHGFIHVTASEVDGPSALPVRIQILPTDQELSAVPSAFGEAEIAGGRLYVEYAITGDASFRVTTGSWEVVVSRGYEYEIYRETVPVVADDTVEVAAALEHSVETNGLMCGDFHIHTLRSPDSGDDPHEKVMSAAADGLEIPVRTEHERVDTFEDEISDLQLGDWTFPVGSLELTTMEAWGHFGVFPLTKDPAQRNNGAPVWVDFPTAASPETPVELLSPPDVFAKVRARASRPAIIVNHPRGGMNYFEHVGLDPLTGLVDNEGAWDDDIRLVEVFNNSSWNDQRNSETGEMEDVVADWLALLGSGRRVFAMGSSDSHGISSSPVGYPRTCLAVGTDLTSELTTDLIRDTAYDGHSVISGGIYIKATVGGAGPGEDATGSEIDIEVQAARWIDIDTLEVVVDGEVVHSIALGEEHEDSENPVIRYSGLLEISPAAGGSYVIVAASGASTLEPVHPGRDPFGVTNPIFVSAP